MTRRDADFVVLFSQTGRRFAFNEFVRRGRCRIGQDHYARPMVNLTRIYTRTGDAGETRLGDMSTTTKNDLRLHAYADVDEANAHLGVALATGAWTTTWWRC